MSVTVRFVNTNLMLRRVQCHGKLGYFLGEGTCSEQKPATCKELLSVNTKSTFTLLEGAVGKDRFQSRGSNLRNV